MRAHHRCLLNHDRCRHTADERSNERMHLGILQLFVHHGAINARLAVSAHGFNRGSLRIRLHSHRNWQCVALMAGRSSTQSMALCPWAPTHQASGIVASVDAWRSNPTRHPTMLRCQPMVGSSARLTGTIRCRMIDGYYSCNLSSLQLADKSLQWPARRREVVRV